MVLRTCFLDLCAIHQYVFDSARWFIVIKTLQARVTTTFITPAVYLVIDLLMMLVSLGAFSLLGANAIRWYNHIATSRGNPAPIPIDRFIQEASDNFWQNGMWFAIMFAGLLLPTIINLCIFLSSGVLKVIPDFTRNRIAAACERDPITRREADILAWQISAANSLTGIIFFVVGIALLGYIIVWLLPAVGEILRFVAEIRLI